MGEAAPPLTPELSDRVKDLIAWLVGDKWTEPPTVLFIDQAYKRHIGLVDLSRRAFLVDQSVHQGVLFRLQRERERADQAEALLAVAIEHRARELFEDSWPPSEHGDAWNWPVHQQDGTQESYRTLARAELTKPLPEGVAP